MKKQKPPFMPERQHYTAALSMTESPPLYTGFVFYKSNKISFLSFCIFLSMLAIDTPMPWWAVFFKIVALIVSGWFMVYTNEDLYLDGGFEE